MLVEIDEMHNYQHLGGWENPPATLDDEKEDEQEHGGCRKQTQWKAALLGILIGLVLSGLVVFVGQPMFGNEGPACVQVLKFMSPPGEVPVMFTNNNTFELEPSEISDAAWRTILPNGLGFVQHPSLGPRIVGLAFVHQLHCVNNLRRGYYAALQNETTNISTHHIQHCLGYLRQSIMCQVDTNLEYRELNEATRRLAVTGRGEHKCRNFNEVYDFAEKWRVWNGKSEAEKERISDADDIPSRTINYDYVPPEGPAIHVPG